MKGFNQISCLIIILVIFPFVLVYSQAEQYKFRHLTTKEGLPSNNIKSIIKDKNGFMWFGTENGLAKYDGYEISTYIIQDDSIAESGDQNINSILDDNEGNLWVGTSQYGLQLFNRIDEIFIHFIHDPEKPYSLSHNNVKKIYQDKNKDIWIGTYGGGLNKFDFYSQKFATYKQEPENPYSKKDKVITIFEDNSGTLWIGTMDGLYLFDRENEIFTPFDFGVDIPEGYYRRVNCIIEDVKGIIWIATHWGLFKYEKFTGLITNYLPHDLLQFLSKSQNQNTVFCNLNLFIMSIVESNEGNEHILWIATKWGLNRFDIDNETFEDIHENPNNPQSISTSSLDELYLDDVGQLWIGTLTAGVDVFNTRVHPFNQVLMRIPGEDFFASAACFLIDNEQTLWIGGIDGGVFQYDRNFNIVTRYEEWDFAPDKPQNNRVDCLFEDSDNNLWLGFYEWGLVLFDREQKSFSEIEMQNITNTPKPNTIDQIIEDIYGMLWIGTNVGLYIKNKNEGLMSPARMIKHDVLSKAKILRIFEDTRSNLWISTRDSGLYCLKPNGRKQMKFVSYSDSKSKQDGFFGNYVSSIYEDHDRVLWLGTDLGLNKLNFSNGKFEPDAKFNDEHAGLIVQIYGDKHDNLWIFHGLKGLIRYKPESKNRNEVKVFDMKDGLPFDKFNTFFSYINSFYQSNDGRLLLSSGIGTGQGFLWFHPDSIKDNKQVPNVVLTKLNVGDKGFFPDTNILVKKHISLNYDQNFFSFEFAALDYLIPEKNRYAYYLDGYEEEWIYSGNRRYANYTGVPPGEYTFRVKGSNNDGYWNEEGVSLAVTILPPPWKTWWAYSIYFLIFVAVIYSIIHYYLRRQRLLSNLALEQFESEKLKELDTLKTKFFTNISHEFRTPLTLILGPIQQLITKVNDQSDKQALSMVYQNANRLRDLVNQLLNLSKLESGKMKLQCTETNIIVFVRNYVQSFESLAKHENINLVFTTDEKEILVFIDKEKISQVLNNLLSNAFKFTNSGGRIEVAVTPLNPRLTGGQAPLRGENSMSQLNPTDRNSNAPSPLQGGMKGVNISISDTGKGIPLEKLQHIFNRFYQADDSISREREGTGIGLAIVKEMVNLHHGKIDVESTVEKGTTFTIYLPLDKTFLKPDEIETSKDSETDIVHAKHILQKTDKRKIIDDALAEENEIESQPILLIVEDNPDMRTFIRGFFKEDFKILEAGDGEDGLTIAANNIPDIIISDVMMPRMDGYEFCQKIKTDEKTSHIPVILLTARASKESRMEGLETGADDFITKPFDGEELQVRVKNLIDQRKKLSEHYRKDYEVIQENVKEKFLTLDEKFLQKAKRIVEKNLSNPEYGVEEFASDMALSRYQLHRKLSALVKQPITEFIRTIRLNYAIELLKKRSGTISEIAYDAGFNNPTYFSISFKKHFGISPKEYINQVDQKENI